MDSIETSSSVSSSGVPETLEINEDCASEINEYKLNNFREQSNELVANIAWKVSKSGVFSDPYFPVFQTSIQ